MTLKTLALSTPALANPTPIQLLGARDDVVRGRFTFGDTIDKSRKNRALNFQGSDAVANGSPVLAATAISLIGQSSWLDLGIYDTAAMTILFAATLPSPTDVNSAIAILGGQNGVTGINIGGSAPGTTGVSVAFTVGYTNADGSAAPFTGAGLSNQPSGVPNLYCARIDEANKLVRLANLTTGAAGQVSKAGLTRALNTAGTMRAGSSYTTLTTTKGTVVEHSLDILPAFLSDAEVVTASASIRKLLAARSITV